MSHTIVGSGTRISKSRLTNSLIGDSVVPGGLRGEVTIGDHSEISSAD